MTIIRFLATVSLVFVCSLQPALAQLRADLFTGGFSQPVAFVQDPSQANVQVVVEQGGRVRVIQNGVLLDRTSWISQPSVLSAAVSRDCSGSHSRRTMPRADGFT